MTDARIISRLADGVVYAARWDDTPRGGSYAYEGYGYHRRRYHEYYG